MSSGWSGVLNGVSTGLLNGVLSGVLSGVLCSVRSGVLSGIRSGDESDMSDVSGFFGDALGCQLGGVTRCF